MYPSVSEEIDEPDVSRTCGFEIPMMEQFNRKSPRFVQSCFSAPECYNGEIIDGQAVKGALSFYCAHGKTNALYINTEPNPIVSSEEKGLFAHSDDEYIVDEKGNSWLMPSDADWKAE